MDVRDFLTVELSIEITGFTISFEIFSCYIFFRDDVMIFLFIQNQNNFASWLLVTIAAAMTGSRQSVKWSYDLFTEPELTSSLGVYILSRVF